MNSKHEQALEEARAASRALDDAIEASAKATGYAAWCRAELERADADAESKAIAAHDAADARERAWAKVRELAARGAK